MVSPFNLTPKNAPDLVCIQVRRYNLRADWQGLTPEEMHATCTDLEHSPEGLDGERFDVIVVSLAAFLHSCP